MIVEAYVLLVFPSNHDEPHLYNMDPMQYLLVSPLKLGANRSLGSSHPFPCLPRLYELSLQILWPRFRVHLQNVTALGGLTQQPRFLSGFGGLGFMRFRWSRLKLQNQTFSYAHITPCLHCITPIWLFLRRPRSFCRFPSGLQKNYSSLKFWDEKLWIQKVTIKPDIVYNIVMQASSWQKRTNQDLLSYSSIRSIIYTAMHVVSFPNPTKSSYPNFFLHIPAARRPNLSATCPEVPATKQKWLSVLFSVLVIHLKKRSIHNTRRHDPPKRK